MQDVENQMAKVARDVAERIFMLPEGKPTPEDHIAECSAICMKHWHEMNLSRFNETRLWEPYCKAIDNELNKLRGVHEQRMDEKRDGESQST